MLGGGACTAAGKLNALKISISQHGAVIAQRIEPAKYTRSFLQGGLTTASCLSLAALASGRTQLQLTRATSSDRLPSNPGGCACCVAQ